MATLVENHFVRVMLLCVLTCNDFDLCYFILGGTRFKIPVAPSFFLSDHETWTNLLLYFAASIKSRVSSLARMRDIMVKMAAKYKNTAHNNL